MHLNLFARARACACIEKWEKLMTTSFSDKFHETKTNSNHQRVDRDKESRPQKARLPGRCGFEGLVRRQTTHTRRQWRPWGAMGVSPPLPTTRPSTRSLAGGQTPTGTRRTSARCAHARARGAARGRGSRSSRTGRHCANGPRAGPRSSSGEAAAAPGGFPPRIFFFFF